MEEIKIDLINGYENLKEFYYKNGNGSIFTCKDTKIPILKSGICLLVTIVLYFIAILSPQIGWIFLVAIFSVSSIILIIDTVKTCGQYLKWKHSVESILDKIKKYKVQQLKLTNDFIEVSNSDERFMDRWDAVKQATMKLDSILLNTDSRATYIFPAKSMKPEEFVSLTNFIKAKIENK
jgi:hypothetical protein